MPAIESAPGSSSADGPFMRMTRPPSGRKWRARSIVSLADSSARVTTAFASKKECAPTRCGVHRHIRKPELVDRHAEEVDRLWRGSARMMRRSRLHDFKRDAGKARTGADVHHRRRDVGERGEERAVHEVLYDDVLETLQAREVELVVVALDEVVKAREERRLRSSTVRPDSAKSSCMRDVSAGFIGFVFRTRYGEDFSGYGAFVKWENGIGRRAAMRHRMGTVDNEQKALPRHGGG